MTISHNTNPKPTPIHPPLNRPPPRRRCFWPGILVRGFSRPIAWRTYLVRDPHALSLLDAALAEHAGAWGPLSAPKPKRPSTPGSIATIPGRCGAAVSRPAPPTYASVIPMRTPAPPRCGAGCTPTRDAGSPLTEMAHGVCEDDPRTLAQRRADALGALAPPAPTTWRAAAASPTAPPVPATTSGPPVWSSTSPRRRLST